MKKIIFSFLFLCTVMACSGSDSLQGGTEFGNPATRALTGQIDGASCPADTVIATDSTGSTSTATVASNCSFNLSLTTQKAYSLAFVLNDVFVATLFVQRGSQSLLSGIIFIASGGTGLDLGTITLSSGQALPSREPYRQMDRDSDGRSDYDDDDDDDDGFSDDDEDDCDLDGYLDDEDDSDDDCSDDGNDNSDSGDDGSQDEEARVLQVFPSNGSENVSLNSEIEIRFNCSIDDESFSDSLVSLSNGSSLLDLDCNLENSDETIECELESGTLASDTTYTVSIDSIDCEEGTITDIEWSFTTL